LLKSLPLAVLILGLTDGTGSSRADETAEKVAVSDVREELWAIPSLLPMLAYTIRPAGNGPFPLLIMNHGVSLDPKERSYFPEIEFRDAA
jgi:hypothetical protein